MSKLKPKPVEAYECPTCKAIITGSYKEAQAHVDSPIDKQLPIGFVYFKDERAYIIFDEAGLSRLGAPHAVHGHQYFYGEYHFLEHKMIHPNSASIVNSKYVRAMFKDGNARFLTEKEFEEIINAKKFFPGMPERLKRILPSLEKLVQTSSDKK